MDLYEALKSGTSVEVLKDTFDKELKEATAKLEAEKHAKELAHYVDIARGNLIEALLQYCEVIGCKTDSNDAKELEETFRNLEKIFINLNQTINDATKSTEKSDDYILQDFVKKLFHNDLGF